MKNCRQQAAYILQEQETAPGKNERRAILQPWGQIGEIHYERVEDYDLEILYELLG